MTTGILPSRGTGMGGWQLPLEFFPAWKEQSRLCRQINRDAWNRRQRYLYG